MPAFVLHPALLRPAESLSKVSTLDACAPGAQEPPRQQHGVPFDLHVYERGPHGLGLGTREWNPAQRHPWTRDCEFWLRERGFGK